MLAMCLALGLKHRKLQNKFLLLKFVLLRLKKNLQQVLHLIVTEKELKYGTQNNKSAIPVSQNNAQAVDVAHNTEISMKREG